MDRSNLHHYQNKGVDFIKEKKCCALFLEMGLGKSISTLTAISETEYKHVLIVAPLRVANTVWKQEAEKWDHTKDLDIGIATGSEVSRRRTVDARHHVTVINRENIPWLVTNFKWRWDMLIIDESSSFKSHSAKRFKALKAVRKYIKSVVLLSGTPSPNGLMDLWSQMYLVDQGERLGRVISNYRKRFFHPAGYMGYQWEINDDSPDRIHALIDDMCLSMESADYIDLPDRIDVTLPIQLKGEGKRLYKEFEKEFLLELENVDIIAVSSAVLANKLLQVANGFAYDEDGTIHNIHTAKMDALVELVEDNAGENILIAYNFKADLEALQKKFPDAVALDKKGVAVDAWNKGEIPILLAHPASAGHGLNLQKGGSMIVWYGMNWSLELYQQFNARLHRQGQERPVRIVHIVAEGTIDERIVLALKSKAKTQKDLLDYLK